jgi:hypothetical protein
MTIHQSFPQQVSKALQLREQYPTVALCHPTYRTQAEEDEAQAEEEEAPASPPLCLPPANDSHAASTHIALIVYSSLSVAGARHTMIDDNTDPGVTIEPDDRPTPVPNPISQTERLQLAAAEWNILLHQQPIEV